MTNSNERPYPGVPVIDADGHVLEPRDLWAKKLPAKYRDQAIEIRWNEETRREDEWAGGVNIMPGLGTTNGWARLPRSIRDDPTGLRWEDLTAAGRNAKDRVIELDRDAIDLAVLYPSLGLVLGGLTDVGHAVAACAIYNDWLAEYVSVAPNRLAGVGAIPMQNPAAAVKEAERAVRANSDFAGCSSDQTPSMACGLIMLSTIHCGRPSPASVCRSVSIQRASPTPSERPSSTGISGATSPRWARSSTS